MSMRVAPIGIAVTLFAAGGYYGSPYWAANEMHVAAQAGERDRLAAYVDFSAVRESLKSQLQADSTKPAQTEELNPNPFAGPSELRAGGTINRVVDSMVTSEGLVNVLSHGAPTRANPNATPPANTSTDGKCGIESGKPPRVEHQYESLHVFKVQMYDPQTDKPMLTMVLNREHLFGWKLKSIRLASLTGV
ncbi:MAG: DUF2939 domain-containing protein [Casimicrobiaceae bacterium]